MNLLYPKVPKSQWEPLWKSALTGFVIAAVYGVVHDLFTFSIGPEYFTRLKFDQFAWANVGQAPAVFAATVGAIASGVVGLFGGWFLARVALPRHPQEIARRRIRTGILITFALALCGAVCGYAYGLIRGPNADYSFWSATVDPLRIEDKYAFIRVAYIHNGSYLGGVVGLVIGLVKARKKCGVK